MVTSRRDLRWQRPSRCDRPTGPGARAAPIGSGARSNGGARRGPQPCRPGRPSSSPGHHALDEAHRRMPTMSAATTGAAAALQESAATARRVESHALLAALLERYLLEAEAWEDSPALLAALSRSGHGAERMAGKGLNIAGLVGQHDHTGHAATVSRVPPSSKSGTVNRTAARTTDQMSVSRVAVPRTSFGTFCPVSGSGAHGGALRGLAPQLAHGGSRVVVLDGGSRAACATGVDDRGE